MKYANQINLALAVVGVLVVLYALSVTFLAPSPSTRLNIQQLVQEGSRKVRAMPSADTSPVLRNSTTTARSSLVGVPGAQPARTPASGIVGLPGGLNRTPPASGALPSTRSNRIGTARGLGSPPPPGSSGSLNPDPNEDESSSYNRAQPTWNLNRPPDGAESAKRGMNDNNTPTPPTRSSMPVQQRRP